jgi:hypothetical protein
MADGQRLNRQCRALTRRMNTSAAFSHTSQPLLHEARFDGAVMTMIASDIVRGSHNHQ